MTPGIYVVLDEQYGMHPTTAQWLSTEYYEGAVSSAPSTWNRPLTPGFSSSRADAMAFIDVQGAERREVNSYWSAGARAATEDNQRPRHPPALPHGDSRLKEHRKKKRTYVCDACGTTIKYAARRMEFDGRFLDTSWRGDMAFVELYDAWSRGDIDATWWCSACHNLRGARGNADLDETRLELGIAWRPITRMTRAAAWRAHRSNASRRTMVKRGLVPPTSRIFVRRLQATRSGEHGIPKKRGERWLGPGRGTCARRRGAPCWEHSRISGKTASWIPPSTSRILCGSSSSHTVVARRS